MIKDLVLTKSLNINAPIAKVWEALTNPELIKIYFFDTECITDWQKGSPIIYKGIWEGKSYEDKGNVLDIEKEKFILCNYWSSFSGTEDIPENYFEIKYELAIADHGTTLKITQSGFKTEEALKHSEANWEQVMNGMKKMLEK